MSKEESGISSIRTVGTFLAVGACSNTLFHVLNRAYNHPLLQEERAALPLAGGIMQHGYQCGMIWGATLAAGAQAYRLHGTGPQAETRAIIAAQRLVESFRARNHDINCFEITELDRSSSTMQLIMYFLIKGGTIGCFRMAAKYAPVAFNEINAALSEDNIEVPSAPISCSAMLARKMGASDEHAVMAAGFAGGIGLSGGACGALGAAIWITGLNSLKAGVDKISFKAPGALEAIDRFLKCTDYEFECSKIVGRKFESVSDHASYLCNGGCSKLIEVLAER
ncbi:MAG: C-GCAxxG-C-C family protein [candidate division Zixibacteria bacterium]|nr:C-GCAxxG-C-C family protein [candidate division Zixibacteria bacterium]